MTLPAAATSYTPPKRDVNGRAFPSGPKRMLTAGVDLAFVNDGCALVLIERFADRIVVPDFDLLQPKPGRPLEPVTTCDAFCARIAAAGCKYVVTDVHYLELMRQAANRNGLALQVAPSGDARTQAFITLRHYTRARTIRLPKAIVDHLRPIELHAQPGGNVSIRAPRTPGTNHSDLSFALTAALYSDTQRHGVLGLTPLRPMSHRGGWTTP